MRFAKVQGDCGCCNYIIFDQSPIIMGKIRCSHYNKPQLYRLSSTKVTKELGVVVAATYILADESPAT